MTNAKKTSGQTAAEKTRQQQENVKQQGHQSGTGTERPAEKYPKVSGATNRIDADKIKKADQKYRDENEETANEKRQSTGSSSRQGV